MYTITVISQKGSVGKTVTTVNLAAALKQKGHDPLVVDYDPQMNATDWLVGREATEDNATIFNALACWDGDHAEESSFANIFRTSEALGVDFIPSDRRMAAASFDAVVGRSPVFPQQFRCRVQEFRTAQVRQNSRSPKKHNYCLVDCLPPPWAASLQRHSTAATASSSQSTRAGLARAASASSKAP